MGSAGRGSFQTAGLAPSLRALARPLVVGRAVALLPPHTRAGPVTAARRCLPLSGRCRSPLRSSSLLESWPYNHSCVPKYKATEIGGGNEWKWRAVLLEGLPLPG